MNFPIDGCVATQASARRRPQTAAAFVRAIEEGQALARTIQRRPGRPWGSPISCRARSPRSCRCRFPVGPVNQQRVQRTADAMLSLASLPRQYAAEVRQGTLIRSMIFPQLSRRLVVHRQLRLPAAGGALRPASGGEAWAGFAGLRDTQRDA